MSNTIEQLKDSAKFHGYFWNGLFAALYEPYREQHSIVSLTVPGKGFFIPASETTIKNYLSCKAKMDFDCFLEYCHGINVDIENKKFLELIPYVNRAYAYLGEQDFSGKTSRSKTQRQKTFIQADYLSDEQRLQEQQLAQDEQEKATIIKTFSSLSQEELSLLYRVADGYPITCECDDTFMDCYCCLNEKGKNLFQEALAVNQQKYEITYNDEFCDFCREISIENAPVIRDITPEMLYDKLNKADYYFLPEDAENLTKYCYAESGTWKTLEQYHKLIFSYPAGNIEGMTFSEKDSLLIFLYWLASIPSLCI